MKTEKILKNMAIGLALLFSASASYAVPLHWSLNGVTFSDGSTASGSFVFDASTTTYSSVLISTTSGFTYSTAELSAYPFNVDANGLELVDGFVLDDNVGKSILNFDFSSTLTNAGGTIGLVLGFPGFEGRCMAANCGSGSILRTVTAGSVIGTAIPEPGTLALLAFGLFGAGFARRRKN